MVKDLIERNDFQILVDGEAIIEKLELWELKSTWC